MMTELTADKIKISGPKIDGSYVITFECGEYQQQNVGELFKIPQGTTIKVKVEYEKTH